MDDKRRMHVLALQSDLLAAQSSYASKHIVTLNFSLRTGSAQAGQILCSKRGFEEICSFVQQLVCSCNTAALDMLFTALDSARDHPSTSSSTTAHERQQCESAAGQNSTELEADHGGGDREMDEHQARMNLCNIRMEAEVGGRLPEYSSQHTAIGRETAVFCKPVLVMEESVQEDLDVMDFNDPANGYVSLGENTSIVAEVLVNRVVVESAGSGSGNTALTIVHCAILAGCEGMLQCLVKWGADVSSTLELELANVAQEMSSLCIAYLLKKTGIVRALLRMGESPYHPSLQQCTWGIFPFFFHPDYKWRLSLPNLLCSNARNFEMDLTLWSCPRCPPPGPLVLRALTVSNDDNRRKILACRRWDTDSVTIDVSAEPYEALEDWMDTPCYTADELTCKKFFCAVSLLRIGITKKNESMLGCLAKENHDRSADKARLLLQHGANPSGVLYQEFEAVCHHWIDIARREVKSRNSGSRMFHSLERMISPSFWASNTRTPRLDQCVDSNAIFSNPQFFRSYSIRKGLCVLSFGYPPALDRLLTRCDPDDDVVRLLVRHGGLPGVRCVEELPFANGQLHDCGLARNAGTCKIAASDVICLATSQPQLLSHLCRTAIIEACQGYGPRAAIKQFRIESQLRDFLLFQ